ncbi:hypothetical protein [Pseudolactococcus insecticola]|uniref:DUF5648 domain-containing protein n=1 Tax=Pseudolactococcus insecticola TaxID=2709158 RepID=A0A6A0B6N9_9LACT|nr:hypothetical protein [Lactococcus insecticola]GFH41000.1 hypothetical protein Hs20B_13980 [Lactococcus insecticola]
MKKLFIALALLFGTAGATTVAHAHTAGYKNYVTIVYPKDSGNWVNMYRVYNPNSGEHFYTASTAERDGLVKAGWKYEGLGWIAPEKSHVPVYRMYNKNAGDHHYTMNAAEKDSLVKAGWRYEGIGWYSSEYSADAKQSAVYRAYNPNAKAGSHNYTLNPAEQASLVKAGWKNENVAWYAVLPNSTTQRWNIVVTKILKDEDPDGKLVSKGGATLAQAEKLLGMPIKTVGDPINSGVTAWLDGGAFSGVAFQFTVNKDNSKITRAGIGHS